MRRMIMALYSNPMQLNKNAYKIRECEKTMMFYGTGVQRCASSTVRDEVDDIRVQ